MRGLNRKMANAVGPDKAAAAAKEKHYDEREKLKKVTKSMIGDDFAIRTTKRNNDNQNVILETYYKKFNEMADIVQADKKFIHIHVDDKEMGVNLTSADSLLGLTLPSEFCEKERSKLAEFNEKMKSNEDEKKIVHNIPIKPEHVIVLSIGDGVPQNVGKKIIEYVKSDLAFMGGKGSRPFGAKEENTTTAVGNGLRYTAFSTNSATVVNRIGAAICTSLVTNKGINMFKNEFIEACKTMNYDIHVEITNDGVRPMMKEEIEEAIVKNTGVKVKWPGLRNIGGGVWKGTVMSCKPFNVATEIVCVRNGATHMTRSMPVMMMYDDVYYELEVKESNIVMENGEVPDSATGTIEPNDEEMVQREPVEGVLAELEADKCAARGGERIADVPEGLNNPGHALVVREEIGRAEKDHEESPKKQRSPQRLLKLDTSVDSGLATVEKQEQNREDRKKVRMRLQWRERAEDGVVGEVERNEILTEDSWTSQDSEMSGRKKLKKEEVDDHVGSKPEGIG